MEALAEEFVGTLKAAIVGLGHLVGAVHSAEAVFEECVVVVKAGVFATVVDFNAGPVAARRNKPVAIHIGVIARTAVGLSPALVVFAELTDGSARTVLVGEALPNRTVRLAFRGGARLRHGLGLGLRLANVGVDIDVAAVKASEEEDATKSSENGKREFAVRFGHGVSEKGPASAQAGWMSSYKAGFVPCF